MLLFPRLLLFDAEKFLRPRGKMISWQLWRKWQNISCVVANCLPPRFSISGMFLWPGWKHSTWTFVVWIGKKHSVQKQNTEPCIVRHRNKWNLNLNLTMQANDKGSTATWSPSPQFSSSSFHCECGKVCIVEQNAGHLRLSMRKRVLHQ